MGVSRFQSGDQVFHPIYGLGVIEGLTTREQAGQKADYYSVRLPDKALLSVPVTRAEALGLRHIANSLAVIRTGLHSSAQPLPDDDRQRFIELRARSQSPGAMALIQAVRDLLDRGRTRKLTSADQKWLVAASERLSAEAAQVDEVDLAEARAVLQQEIDSLSPNGSPNAQSAKARSGAGK